MSTTEPLLPEPVKNVLVDVFTLSTGLPLREDSRALLQLLRRVLPSVVDLQVIEAWQLLQARDYIAAREVLEDAERAHGDRATVKALLAMCLHDQQDPLWQGYAEEARQLPDNADALAIVNAIALDPALA